MVQAFGWEGWFSLAVIVGAFVLLLKEVAPADLVFLFALAIVMCAQVVSTEEALSGFSNSAVLTVAILYVVAAGINSTGALDYVFNKILGKPKTLALAQLRLMVPVGVVSAFLNNTPVVAVMIPIIQKWARRINQPVSQLFIPLSFASILGGTCTLIGTSTNLVVAGKYEEKYGKKMGMFDISIVGVPTLLMGFSYIVLFSPCLLPGFPELERRSRKAFGLDSEEGDDTQTPAVPPGIGTDFTVACVVTRYSTTIGKAVDEASLRGLDGLYLTSAQRGDRLFYAVGPEFVILENDILFFTGVVDNFDDFCTRHGFEIITDANEDMLGSEYHVEGDSASGSFASCSRDTNKENPSKRLCRSSTFESRIQKVVVRSGGILEGSTAKESMFRKRYDAAIISLYRMGEKITVHGNIGRMVLRVGDVLLLVVGDSFSWDKPETERDLKPFIADEVVLAHHRDELGAPIESERVSIAEANNDIEREFLIPMRVTENPQLLGARTLIGATVESAGLRGLPGLFLIAIEHETGLIDHVVGPHAVLEAGDMLWFAGEREALSTLRRIPGIESPDAQANKLKVKKVHRRLVECVLSFRSNMVGKTVREAKFRTRFEAAIIAVHRQGRRVLSKIGDIELRAGDVLILDTGPNFVMRYKDDPNFLLATEIDDSAPPRFDKFYIALTATIAMIVAYLLAGDYITLFEPAVFASGIMLVAGGITPERARASVSWDVIVTIACAFGLSSALENTGVATTIGESLVYLADITHTGFVGVLVAVYMATFLVSIVVANNAAALLLFPVAVKAAEESGGSDLAIQQTMFVLMLAASSSFSSPYGYQTNIMVLNCGNYVFGDFLKFGFPMQFWQMVFSVTFVYYCDYWYFTWLGTFALFAGLITLRVISDRKRHLNAASKNIPGRTEKNDDATKDEPPSDDNNNTATVNIELV
uniref:RCK C-terminal domain-containing protein n=1 Tax=Mucochytrium quahogii TaxID=96639 RepID=A0A7S2SLT6_9STRA|mmetsp:Transcript_7914/g.17329  ORF Transcript_7914/g.17329 Transcript_7914/m.17329 type:complete len:933 (+) Transcript_7914:330-3128(+)